MEGWLKILVYLTLGGFGGLLLAGGFVGIIDGRVIPRNVGLVLLALGAILIIIFGEPSLATSIINQIQ